MPQKCPWLKKNTKIKIKIKGEVSEYRERGLEKGCRCRRSGTWLTRARRCPHLAPTNQHFPLTHFMTRSRNSLTGIFPPRALGSWPRWRTGCRSRRRSPRCTSSRRIPARTWCTRTRWIRCCRISALVKRFEPVKSFNWPTLKVPVWQGPTWRSVLARVREA